MILLSFMVSCRQAGEAPMAPSTRVRPNNTALPNTPTLTPTTLPTPSPTPTTALTPTQPPPTLTPTPSGELKTDIIHFSGVQFPENLEVMRQDISFLSGIQDVQIGYESVKVIYNPDQVNLEEIMKVIRSHGFEDVHKIEE
jgi:hypothetical protein